MRIGAGWNISLPSTIGIRRWRRWRFTGRREVWPGLQRFFTDRVTRRRYVKYKLAPKLAVPWFLRFVYMYFIRGGILDRRPGLTLCLMISTYELFIRA